MPIGIIIFALMKNHTLTATIAIQVVIYAVRLEQLLILTRPLQPRLQLRRTVV